jgi:hypothetical protein
MLGAAERSALQLWAVQRREEGIGSTDIRLGKVRVQAEEYDMRAWFASRHSFLDLCTTAIWAVGVILCVVVATVISFCLMRQSIVSLQ